MPTFPTLVLLSRIGSSSDHPNSYRQERAIDRNILLDVAPDREDLIMSGKDIEELRLVLKVRIGSTKGHWLYRIRQHTNARTKDATTRTSTIIRGAPIVEGENRNIEANPNGNVHVVRRVLSASSLSPISNTMASIESRLVVPQDSSFSIDIWGLPNLSTAEKMISPRPLGPTHILIARGASGSSVLGSTNSGTAALRRKKSTTPTFSRAIELPINDLLFILNVPNLLPSIPVLPRRLHRELPRILMDVPHLETFPELVVYLHTKNQAELFRKVIPEWIRDLMHPLPNKVDASVGNFASNPTETRCGQRGPKQLFNILVTGLTSSYMSDEGLSSSVPSETARSIDSISREIAEDARLLVFPAAESGLDPLLHTVSLLDALCDNLEYIGYFSKSLWSELDIYRDILIRAISWKAKISDEFDLED